MDALLQSDIAYISGHGYFGGVIPIYHKDESDFLGMFVANNDVKSSQFHIDEHYQNLSEDVLNNRFSFKEAENETIENLNLQWLITAACSQLNNYIEKDSNGNDRQDMIFDDKYTYEYWLDTLINNKNMKGILGYHFTSPSSNGDVNDESIIKNFFGKQ